MLLYSFSSLLERIIDTIYVAFIGKDVNALYNGMLNNPRA